jgi:uncharacterized protein
LRPFVTGYLAIIGVFILYKALSATKPIQRELGNEAAPLGLIGGFVDAVGGGGWGPVVTSSLVASGGAPRQVIGTVNAAEFLVTCAISATFIVTIVTGTWLEGADLKGHAWAVGGLIVGGVLAAPLAAWIVKVIKQRTLMIMVGLLILFVAGFQTAKLTGLV